MRIEAYVVTTLEGCKAQLGVHHSLFLLRYYSLGTSWQSACRQARCIRFEATQQEMTFTQLSRSIFQLFL